jgi:tripartite-type tricarboxylate transporter receptor subunit TctC
VAGAWFAQEAGIKLEHVPYRGAGQAINDLIATHVKTAFLGPTVLVQHYKAGVLKLLAHTGSKRSPILPEIPTLDEAGYPVVLDAWYGAFVPHGTPRELVIQLNTHMNHALKDDKLRETFIKGVVEVIGGTPEEFGKLALADSAKYARLVKELKIQIN